MIKDIKTVAIVGLGALGILFGHHLSKKMPFEDLRIIANQDRIDRYKKDKVYSNGEECNFNYVTPNEDLGPADLVFFTVKFNDLDSAIEDVRNHIGDDTIILSCLNGIVSEEIISKTYGWDKILYCIAQGMDGIRKGNVLEYTNMGMLCFGDREPGIISDKVKAVENFFIKTDFPHEVATDMQHRLWGKFMLNVGVNQTVAIFRGNYGTIQKDGEERNIMISAMREVITLANKEEVNLTEKDLDYWLDVLSKLDPRGKPSMAQDIDNKRFSEVDLFAGTVIEMGKKHGIATPVNQMLYDRIKYIESTF